MNRKNWRRAGFCVCLAVFVTAGSLLLIDDDPSCATLRVARENRVAQTAAGPVRPVPRVAQASRVEPRATLPIADPAGTNLAPALWELGEETTHAPPFPIPDVVGKRFSVRLFREQLAQVEVGLSVPIEIPGLGTFHALVQHREISTDGDRSWRGHIESGGNRYPVVYTQGNRATFATIGTPDGTYALEALDDGGQLFKDNRFDLGPPGGLDYLIETK